MSTEIELYHDSKMDIWTDTGSIAEIKKIFAPTLTGSEFDYYVGIGKQTGLNPFLREIWAVKYSKDAPGQKDAPAQIFIGRDGYRKCAQRHVEYDYHQSDAVYENDIYEIVNGEVKHSYNLKNRGKLIGAYCLVKRKSSSRPMYVFAELSEYSTGKRLWNKDSGKPATMIKKVAESQGLRAGFQDLFGGTYGEEEMERKTHHEEIRVINNYPEGMTQTERVKQSLLTRTKGLQNVSNNAVDTDDQGICIEPQAVTNSAETVANVKHDSMEPKRAKKADAVIEAVNIEKATAEQVSSIEGLTFVNDFPADRMRKALNHYGVAIISELSKNDADDFIRILEKEFPEPVAE